MNGKQIAITGLGATAVAGGIGGTYYLSKEKTIRDRLTREEFELINSDEGYQIAFKELKKEANFIEEIKKETNNVSETSSLVDGGKAVETWCNKKLGTYLTDKDIESLIKKVKNYCLNRSATIIAKLRKEGKEFTTKWREKLATLKVDRKDPELQKELAVINSEVTTLESPNEEKAINALRDWCNKYGPTKIIKDENDEVFEKVKKRCLEEAKQTGDV